MGLKMFAQWELVSKFMVEGKNVYTDTTVYHFPPLWGWTLYLTYFLSVWTHIPLFTLVKVPPILCDIILSILMYITAIRMGLPHKDVLAITLLCTFNPILIIVSSIHGQFDSIPCLFSFLAWLFLQLFNSPRKEIYSSLSLGIAVLSKFYPVILLPFFLQKVERKKWGLYLSLAILPTFFSLLPYGKLFPEVSEVIISYTGVFPWWGYYATLTFANKILNHPPILQNIMGLVATHSKYLCVGFFGIRVDTYY